jgi:hypothetical protein
MLRERESEMYGVKFAEVLKAAGMLAGTFSLPAGSRAPSLIVVAVDDEGNRLADFLFQKFPDRTGMARPDRARLGCR